MTISCRGDVGHVMWGAGTAGAFMGLGAASAGLAEATWCGTNYARKHWF